MHKGLCIFDVKAQDYPAAVLDGQDIKIGSLSVLPSFNLDSRDGAL